MEEPLISDLSLSCVEQFQGLLVVAPRDGRCLDADFISAVEEQFGRFNIWAGNLGVFARAHASLDYRLRDSPKAKSLFLRQLEGLQSYFERVLRYINEKGEFGEDSDEEDLQINHYDLQHSSFASSSLFSTADDDTNFEQPIRGFLHYVVQGIGDVINRLYRLSMFIRESSRLNENPRAEAFVMKDEEGNDVGEAFHRYVLQMIKRRHPDMALFLLNRLSDAIVSRRKRFLWRQRHQQKLDTKGLLPSHAEDLDIRGLSKGHNTVTFSQTDHTVLAPSREPTLKAVQSTKFSNTTASKVLKDGYDYPPDLDAPVTVASTSIVDDPALPLAVPPPPKLPLGCKEFVCPYCCTVLLAKDSQSQRWRSHVMNDLEPLVCLFEGCTDNRTMYRSKSLWLSHLQSHQRMRWICRSPGHKAQTFDAEALFEAHMHTSHKGTFSEAQIPFLKQRSQYQSPCPFSSCPICHSHDHEAVDLMDHIQAHLQSIALLSLPWLDNVVDASSGKTSSVNQSEGSLISDSLDMTLDFEDLGMISRIDDQDGPGQADNEQGLIDSGWDFLPQLYYGGHERDPVLQPFLRKLYLGLSAHKGNMQGPRLPCRIKLDYHKQPFSRIDILDALAKGLCPKHAHDTSTEHVMRTYALCGPGGMGKTLTAVEFVRQHRECFDAVLWVHCDSQTKLLQDYRDITVKLGLIAEDSVDANDQILTRNLLKSWLINPRKSRDSNEKASWLLILDGVNDAALLDNAWPYDGPGSVLITSRDPLSFDFHSNILKLGPLESDEAIRFLLFLIGKKNDTTEMNNARAIVERIGGIPLILAQMAGMIIQQQWSMVEFLEAYGRRASIDNSSPQSIHKHSLASVWALESLGPGREFLNVLSMLDPDGIPERMLTTHMPSSRLAGYPRNANAYSRAKYELLSTSLIREDKQARHLWLHRMCQDVAKMQMDASQYRTTFLECVRIVSEAWPYELFTWRHGIERWEACATFFPHVAWLLQQSDPISVEAKDADGHYEFAKLLTDAAWYRHETGHSDESIRFSDLALSILKSLSSYTDAEKRKFVNVDNENIESTIAEIYHNKGCFATETNESEEALIYHTLFHDMMSKKIQGPALRWDMRLAIAWNELGIAHMLNQAWFEGERCFLRSIEDMKCLDNFDQLQLSLPFVNLGLAYWIVGRLDEAKTTIETALSEREAVYGADDNVSFITGRILHALGNVKFSMGLHEESFGYHRRALLQYKSTLGNNHHRTADLCVKVAGHHLRLRHWELARALLNQALKIYGNGKIFLPERIRAHFNQCKVYRALKMSEAAGMEESLMELYHRLVPTGHRLITELNDQHMDDLIVFWSR